jgi:hypothetical protein
MKMVGFTSLPNLVRAGENATYYMLSSSHRFGKELPMISYSIMVQQECGDDVHYWLLQLGSEPAAFASHELPPDSARNLALSAEKAVTTFLKLRGIFPHSALIAYPKDLVLLNGDYSDFMDYDRTKKQFVLLE